MKRVLILGDLPGDGIERLALVYGWSMGAQQALHWGVLHPDEVARICAVCGSARTSTHNLVFLEGVRGARWWRVGVPWAGLGSREPCSGLFGGSPPPTLEPGGSWPLGRREWPLLRPSMSERGRWATP